MVELTAKLKLDNSEGGREMDVSFKLMETTLHKMVGNQKWFSRKNYKKCP